MWSTGTLLLCCLISFLLGQAAMMFLTALGSVNEEDDNDDEQ